MSTIAYRNGVLAADGRATQEGIISTTQKLFRLGRGKSENLVALAGACEPSILFLRWFSTVNRGEPPKQLIEGKSMTALVLNKDGLFEYGNMCVPERIIDEYYAIGSGTQAALAAMKMGADAKKAVLIACSIDCFSGPPITAMSLRR